MAHVQPGSVYVICVTVRFMRPGRAVVATLALMALWAEPALAQRADLARARTLYNQRQFDGAIEAAQAAQKIAATADAGAVVLARAHLERYRERVALIENSHHHNVWNPKQSVLCGWCPCTGCEFHPKH